MKTIVQKGEEVVMTGYLRPFDISNVSDQIPLPITMRFSVTIPQSVCALEIVPFLRAYGFVRIYLILFPLCEAPWYSLFHEWIIGLVAVSCRLKTIKMTTPLRLNEPGERVSQPFRKE